MKQEGHGCCAEPFGSACGSVAGVLHGEMAQNIDRCFSCSRVPQHGLSIQLPIHIVMKHDDFV
jgi:hypothetical protein